jgi:catalase (peroxidase I)
MAVGPIDRGDATQDWTHAESLAVMEPVADGFRNYLKTRHSVKTEELLLDRASLLGLSVLEMTVLVGGLRVLGANYKDAPEGVLTDHKGQRQHPVRTAGGSTPGICAWTERDRRRAGRR